jgi:hypothetical protein
VAAHLNQDLLQADLETPEALVLVAPVVVVVAVVLALLALLALQPEMVVRALRHQLLEQMCFMPEEEEEEGKSNLAALRPQAAVLAALELEVLLAELQAPMQAQIQVVAAEAVALVILGPQAATAAPAS